jgi:Zn-dependent M28 family amino/carboxypeptidase
VIGKIEGSDRADEAVTYTAHWDHLGLCAPPGAPDRICNGAVDNASGVAMMIEIARQLAKGPQPRRSLYFIATTAEESGLLGAKAFVRNPPLPLDNIVAEMNLDTVALAPAGAPIAIIGRGEEPLASFIDQAARALGRKIDDSTAANAFLNRQDGSVFLKAGVPSVMIGGAFSDPVLLARFLTGPYHHPNDDLKQGIELGGAAEDGALHVALGRLFADPAKFGGSRNSTSPP